MAQCISAAMDYTYSELTINRLKDAAYITQNEPKAINELSNCRFVTDDILQCKMMIAPILKKGYTKDPYYAHVCAGLQENVMQLCRGKKSYKKVTVCFINHVKKGDENVPSYFDNDNLAIKGILDAIIPFICPDDAAKYIDNLYFTKTDSCSYTEVFIINEGHLSEWLSKFPDYDFTKK